MTLTRRRREDQTSGLDGRTRRTDSTSARGRRRLTLADAAESAEKRTQVSHPALEHCTGLAERPTTTWTWRSLKQAANSKGGGRRGCCSVKVNRAHAGGGSWAAGRKRCSRVAEAQHSRSEASRAAAQTRQTTSRADAKARASVGRARTAGCGSRGAVDVVWAPG